MASQHLIQEKPRSYLKFQISIFKSPFSISPAPNYFALLVNPSIDIEPDLEVIVSLNGVLGRRHWELPRHHELESVAIGRLQ